MLDGAIKGGGAESFKRSSDQKGGGTRRRQQQLCYAGPEKNAECSDISI